MLQSFLKKKAPQQKIKPQRSFNKVVEEEERHTKQQPLAKICSQLTAEQAKLAFHNAKENWVIVQAAIQLDSDAVNKDLFTQRQHNAPWEVYISLYEPHMPQALAVLIPMLNQVIEQNLFSLSYKFLTAKALQQEHPPSKQVILCFTKNDAKQQAKKILSFLRQIGMTLMTAKIATDNKIVLTAKSVRKQSYFSFDYSSNNSNRDNLPIHFEEQSPYFSYCGENFLLTEENNQRQEKNGRSVNPLSPAEKTALSAEIKNQQTLLPKGNDSIVFSCFFAAEQSQPEYRDIIAAEKAIELIVTGIDISQCTVLHCKKEISKRLPYEMQRIYPSIDPKVINIDVNVLFGHEKGIKERLMFPNKPEGLPVVNVKYTISALGSTSVGHSSIVEEERKEKAVPQKSAVQEIVNKHLQKLHNVTVTVKKATSFLYSLPFRSRGKEKALKKLLEKLQMQCQRQAISEKQAMEYLRVLAQTTLVVRGSSQRTKSATKLLDCINDDPQLKNLVNDEVKKMTGAPLDYSHLQMFANHQTQADKLREQLNGAEQKTKAKANDRYLYAKKFKF